MRVNSDDQNSRHFKIYIYKTGNMVYIISILYIPRLPRPEQFKKCLTVRIKSCHILSHLHKSRYCVIVPLHNPLTKAATKSLASI